MLPFYRCCFLRLMVCSIVAIPIVGVAQEKSVARTPVYNRIGMELRGYIVVSQIIPGSPAQKAGFQLGDWIFQPSGASFGKSEDFINLVKAKSPNSPMEIKVVRPKQTINLTATLDQYDPTSTTPKEQRGRLGLGVRNTVVIQNIQQGSPTEKAGFKVGDQILSVNALATPTQFEANAALVALSDDTEAKVQFQRGDKTYIATLNSGKAIAPTEEVLNATDTFLDVRQNGQTAVDEYLGRKLIVEGRVEAIEPVKENVEIAFQTPFNTPSLDDPNKVVPVVLVTVPKRLAVDLKRGDLFRFRGELADPQIGKAQGLILSFVSIERLPVAPNDPSNLPEVKGNARYDRKAIKLFLPLERLYSSVVGNYAQTNTDYLNITDYFYGKVGAIFPDKPQPGQAAVVIETGSETVQNGSKVPAIVLVYGDKLLAQFCKQGETHYFQGKIRRLTPEQKTGNSPQPATMFIEGVFPFPSPGAAFNPSRPLLRSSVKSPAGTVKIAEMIKEAAASTETLKNTYLSKPKTFEGYVKEWTKSGNSYLVTFDTQEPAGRENFVVAVRIDGSYAKSMEGFKRTYLLRFDGSLKDITTVKKKRAKLGGPNETEEYEAVQLNFEAAKIHLREKPL